MAKRKLGRGTAGDKLHLRTSRLSDALLEHETKCQTKMEEIFTWYVEEASAMVSTGLKASRVVKIVGELAEEAVIETRKPFGNLVSDAVTLGMDSIRTELIVCEETLGAKYEGLGDRAYEAAVAGKNRLASFALGEYGDLSIPTVEWFEGQLAVELRASRSNGEPMELLISRLVSPDRLRGVSYHRGRGLWWKMLEHCNRVSRETEFVAVNTGRQWAMEAFNRIGADM